MAERLRVFIEGSTSLAKLIDDLDAIVRCLNEPDPAWKDLFRNEWLALEEVYSVALDGGKSSLSAQDENIVNRAVNELMELVRQKVPQDTGESHN